MSYVKRNPRPAGLEPGETALTLDTGEHIAVSCALVPQTNNAPSFIVAVARLTDADGATLFDALGQPIRIEYRHTPTAAQANDAALLAAMQRDCLMAVLGEPLAGPLQNPQHANAIANCSIRHRIAALSAAGAVDVAALL